MGGADARRQGLRRGDALTRAAAALGRGGTETEREPGAMPEATNVSAERVRRQITAVLLAWGMAQGLRMRSLW